MEKEKQEITATSAPKAKTSFGVYFRRYWQLYALLALPLLYLLVFKYIPMAYVQIAFKKYQIGKSIWTMPLAKNHGFEYYIRAFKDRDFLFALRNTLLLNLKDLIFGFPAPIILALLLNEVRSAGFKKTVQTISYLPHFLSWIILGGMVVNWLSTNGMLNNILLHIGILDEPKNFLLDSGKYWWIAVLSDTWKEAGWGTILYLATMAGIDPTYYEAAKIDGAGKMRQILSITLPMLKTIISLNFILTISNLFKSNLDQTLVLMNSQNQSKAEVIDSYVYRMGLTQGDFSYATAVGLGVSIVSVILLLLANSVTKKLNEESVL